MPYSPSTQLSFSRLLSTKPVLGALAGLCLTAYGAAGHAQHMMHGGGDSSAIEVETMPHDDAVLPDSPEQIMLDFGEDVRLVKLTLRTPQSRELLDIGFRYNPAEDMMFTHRLPSLEEAPYYIPEMEEMRHIMAPDYRLQDPEVEYRIQE